MSDLLHICLKGPTDAHKRVDLPLTLTGLGAIFPEYFRDTKLPLHKGMKLSPQNLT